LSGQQAAEQRAADRFTSAYACVSANVAFYCDVKLGLSPAKMTVIPNAVDAARVEAADAAAERRRLRREFGFAEDHFVFLNVASLHPPKAQRELVRAMATLVAARPGAKAVLVGGALDPAYEREVRREIEAAGLASNVIIAGHRDDVASFYHAADAFVLPSYWEGWSLALTEAVCAGLPVVASDVGGIPDVVTDGETGILVPPGDVVALTKALDGVLKDTSLRTRLGEEARRRSARYTWPGLAARIADLYFSARPAAPR
jgi:O-antigen biosynthesis protein